MPIRERQAPHARCALALLIAAAPLGGCASLGALMSPYPEKFACKNPDHGQCIDPAKAYEDARAGRPARSDPAVTRDRKLLKASGKAIRPGASQRDAANSDPAAAGAYAGYRDSVYRELKGLIDQPVTPMLRSGQTVRTLILPYADRQRPDRLYMPRYVYSILERPSWVVGGYLVQPADQAAQLPVLGQMRVRPGEEAGSAAPPPAADLPAGSGTTATQAASAELPR